MRSSPEASLARRGGKASVFVTSGRRLTHRRVRPLLRTLSTEQLVVQRALIIRSAGGAAGEFVEDVGGGGVLSGERFESHLLRDRLDPPPVRLGLAGRGDDLLH